VNDAPVTETGSADVICGATARGRLFELTGLENPGGCT
jgi:hypothetical protein